MILAKESIYSFGYCRDLANAWGNVNKELERKGKATITTAELGHFNKGRKHTKGDPNSVMQLLRHVNNILVRANDEKTYCHKPKRVLKGMLTSHVAEFGPLLPDQSLAGTP